VNCQDFVVIILLNNFSRFHIAPRSNDILPRHREHPFDKHGTTTNPERVQSPFAYQKELYSLKEPIKNGRVNEDISNELTMAY
jgi:hypothetical protein